MDDEIATAIARVRRWRRMRSWAMDVGPVLMWMAVGAAWGQWWGATAVLLVLVLACLPAIWWTGWRENHWRARWRDLLSEADHE